MHPLYDVENLNGKELMDRIDSVSNRLMMARRMNINYDVILQLEEYLAILNLRAYEESCADDKDAGPNKFEIEDYIGKIDDNNNDTDEQDNLFGW